MVDSALKAYKLGQEAERKGERLMHWPKGWKKEEWEVERTKKKENWYKKRGNEAVIFVSSTPGSTGEIPEGNKRPRLWDKGS